jgi:hypothetical protein
MSLIVIKEALLFLKKYLLGHTFYVFLLLRLSKIFGNGLLASHIEKLRGGENLLYL